ncbi:hypothetical protein DR864_28440 (plasmid) [Runella rosea]|uniref:Uncharacterized protein n=1 Tax=Runella rosea TaxID=2259595 RepID=A0A344TT33_9BACT|nr:tetratricopeptide repeat protein [Runella rosea]AXE21804.1 hypothetical protein DR864_28440 [Runella rosea]
MNTLLIITTVTVLCGIVFYVFKKLIEKFSRAYENNYTETISEYNHLKENERYGRDGSQSDMDNIINNYLNIVKTVDSNNPILINTYVSLSQAYEKQGKNQEALNAINQAINVLEKINKNNIYTMQANIYKAQFLHRISKKEEALQVWKYLLEIFPNDKDRLLKKISGDGLSIN